MSLSPNEERELLALLETEASGNLWQPHPENTPQQQAYECIADEMFYGGAAGGGKTDLALGKAVTRHKRSLILRREATQLRGIIERSREIIGQFGRLNQSMPATWRLNDGRIIEMGGCKELEDRQNYQGRPHDLVVFDEAPQFLEAQVDFITGWARTEDPTQSVQVLLTGNPPTTAEGEWVRRRFAAWLDPEHPNPAEPGELRWYVRVAGKDVECSGPDQFEQDGEVLIPKSRTFIPARVDDNPYYRDTGYKATLQALPEPLRSQMLKGDFGAGVEDDPWQVIPTAWVKMAQARWTPEPPDGYSIVDILGVDVARGGKDHSVIAKRHGPWIAPLQQYPGSSTPNGPAVAALVVRAAGSSRPRINIDATGVGAAVYDALAAQGYTNLRGVLFSEGATNRDRSGQLKFANLRAEMYWTLRELLDPANSEELALPPDAQLTADLTTPKFSVTVRGVLVESKEDIYKRLQRSTDCGDAVALSVLKPKPGAFTGVAMAGDERAA